jgi:hypothetical protein
MGDLGHGRGLLPGTLSGKSTDAAQLYDPRHVARICGRAGARRRSEFLPVRGGDIFYFAIHYSLNGHIYADGNAARAQWYLLMPCTVADGNRALRRASIGNERLINREAAPRSAIILSFQMPP